MSRTRTSTLNLRVSEEEREKLHAIADANDEPAAMTVRRWIRTFYAQAFGEIPPKKVARAAGGGARR
ncbi:MAG: hypothetical protein ACLQVI_35150 [Polyangiaceae bacterium]